MNLHRFLRPVLLGILGCFTFLVTSALFGAQAPAPDFTQAEAPAAVVIPSWEDVAADFPKCQSIQTGTDDLATIAVVADADTGEVFTITVAEAWDRALDKREANDVWMLGLCEQTRTA
jgi:hypothetical protein